MIDQVVCSERRLRWIGCIERIDGGIKHIEKVDVNRFLAVVRNTELAEACLEIRNGSVQIRYLVKRIYLPYFSDGIGCRCFSFSLVNHEFQTRPIHRVGQAPGIDDQVLIEYIPVAGKTATVNEILA